MDNLSILNHTDNHNLKRSDRVRVTEGTHTGAVGSVEFCTPHGHVWVQIDGKPEPNFFYPSELATIQQDSAETFDNGVVDQLAAAMKYRLAVKRGEGRSGWNNETQCSIETLAASLIKHLVTGDMVDVANYAMMLWWRAADTPHTIDALRKELAKNQYPEAMDARLAEILGMPNFVCAPFARVFRAAGHDIDTKAEAEQAFVLHWLIRLYLHHGSAWRAVAGEELSALHVKAKVPQEAKADANG